jgi:hypothetical protein
MGEITIDTKALASKVSSLLDLLDDSLINKSHLPSKKMRKLFKIGMPEAKGIQKITGEHVLRHIIIWYIKQGSRKSDYELINK